MIRVSIYVLDRDEIQQIFGLISQISHPEMKWCDRLGTAVLACCLAAPAWAKERPELTLGIAGRHMGLMGVYEPLLTWTHFGQVFGCEYAVSTVRRGF